MAVAPAGAKSQEGSLAMLYQRCKAQEQRSLLKSTRTSGRQRPGRIRGLALPEAQGPNAEITGISSHQRALNCSAVGAEAGDHDYLVLQISVLPKGSLDLQRRS